jgi:hypothetical protein
VGYDLQVKQALSRQGNPTKGSDLKVSDPCLAKASPLRDLNLNQVNPNDGSGLKLQINPYECSRLK